MKKKLQILFSLMCLLFFASSVRAQEDVTTQYLVNADLSEVGSGWTFYSDEYKYQGWLQGDATKTAAVEFYAGWGSLEHTNFKLSQTVTLPAGDYRIAVNAFYREGNSGNGTNADRAWIFAGTKKQNVVALNSMADVSKYDAGGNDMDDAMHAFASGAFSNAFDFSVAEESAIELGFQGCFTDIRQWCILGPVKLYKYSLEDYLVDYRTKVAEAEAVEGKMGAAEEQALKDAIVPESSFTLGSQVSAAIAKLNEAITAAKKSISDYAALATEIANGEAIKTNVSDADAVAEYDAAVADVKAAYEAGTVADFAAAEKTVSDAAAAIVKKQDADGSDYTLAIVNPNINGSDGWICQRPVGGNGPMLNGVSFEYWAGNANPREDASFDYYQDIEGLPNGFYTVSADMYNSLNGEEGAEWASTCGLYGASGENEAYVLVDVEGDQLNSYTTGEIEVTNGKLRIGVKSYEPLAARWFVADNFKLTLVKALGGEPVVEKTPYELAMEELEDGGTYRIFAEYNGSTYYLTETGALTDNIDKATTFTFKKVAGEEYEYGFLVDGGTTRFSNPPGTNESNLKCGYINTSTGVRTNWDAQVFFLNTDGKYAVRSTNATSATSGWGWVGSSYWTIEEVEGTAVAQYQWDPNYIWQIEPYDDPRPAAFAKTESWPYKLQQAVGLVQDASMYTSNAKDPAEGSYGGLLDGDFDSFFHSTWHASNDPGEDHYLQAELTEPVSDFYLYYRRRSQNNNNRPTTIVISASNDGESFTDVQTINEGLPVDASVNDYTSGKISLGGDYKYIRFTVPVTNSGGKTGDHVFFTFSEFYLLPVDDVVEAAAEYIPANSATDITEGDVSSIDAIDEDISALVEKAEAAKAGADLNELIDRILAIIDDKEAYTDEEGVVDPVTAALGSIRGITYETTQEVADQKEEVYYQARTFFAGITPKKDIDVTDYYLVNPTPTRNIDGWEGDKSNAFDAANNNAEFWNMAGASFHQTVTLPAGDYKASVVAVTRDGMTATFSANDAETNIVTMPNSGTEPGVDYLDRRDHCNTWFNAGNGVNTVEFSLEEEGDVTLTLTADTDNGDHWLVWRNFSIIMLAPEPVAPAVVLNAPIWNAEEGTQEEPYMLAEGTPLKITYTADNLEENGISEEEVQVKVTVMVVGDVSTTPEMGSETAHNVMGESFYIPLGEAEFPVALKEGYYYQNIAVMTAQLVKPGTEETPEEVIATYAGAPAMLHWVGVPAPMDSDAAYENALAAIEDGGQYRIFTEIDGQKYYVTEGGLLTSSNKDSGVFTLKKVAGTASQYKEYGFKIDSGSKRFTNPPLANNVADMTRGVFATTTGNRDDWEAQVFFMMGNKYAIRSCNVPDGTSSWNDAGRTYWTWVVEDVPTPQYTYDMVYCWQLEGPLTTINVTYALQEADGTTISSVTKQQESNSEVNVPADLTSHFAYEYAVSGTIGDEDCTITVTRTFKEGVVHSLDELSNEKAYTIRCDRGALLTKDGYVASTAHSSLTNAEAAEFAIINYEGNYYLYSVADGQFMTFDPTVSDDGSRGPLADTPVHGTEDAVILEAKTDPYFFAYFSANGTNYGFNTNGNNPYGYVINSWMNADPGNQYYIIESSDFDPTAALEALEAFFHPELTELNITLDIKRETGLGYGVTVGEVDLSSAKEFLGVEELTTDMLYFVNPDGSEIDYATYAEVNYDGWCNAEGTATEWGTSTAICVKFFQALSGGKFEICDMNGADEVGKTYTVKWAIKANGLSAIYTINVTFEAPEIVEVTDISDKVIQASIEYDYAEPSYVEKTVVLTDEQVATICEELGIASLDEATPYAYNPTTKEVVYVYKAFDGWRDANGDFAMWTGTAAVPACVKYSDGKTYYCYNLQGMKDQEIKCYWAISKDEKAVLVEINFIYSGAPQGTDYAGIINQTQSHPQAGVLGETTSEQTVTVTQNEDGTVNITFSGFDLPMAALGSFGEFTIENVAVTTNDDGSISYAAEGFQVSTGGQMPAPYNGTLEGTQASTDATPVFHLTLQNATTDEVWFGADQAAIDAVGIRGINADEINGTIYDLGGRKVTKIQRGGIYIINGKKVAVK